MTQNAVVIAAGIAGVAGIGVIDRFTGPALDMSVLYLIPVSFTVWFAGWKRAFPVSALAVIVWEIEQLLGYAGTQLTAVTVANIILRFLFFILAVYLISKLKSELDKEKYLARTDVMTGTLNRRAFFEKLEHEIKKASGGGPYALIYFDIDNFKKINDTYGHRYGDRVLSHASAIMKVRTEEQGGAFARIGGDEFAILLLNTDEKRCAEFISRVRGELYSFGGVLTGVTFSFGVVVVRKNFPESAEELLHKADELMYDIKKKSKDAVYMETI